MESNSFHCESGSGFYSFKTIFFHPVLIFFCCLSNSQHCFKTIIIVSMIMNIGLLLLQLRFLICFNKLIGKSQALCVLAGVVRLFGVFFFFPFLSVVYVDGIPFHHPFFACHVYWISFCFLLLSLQIQTTLFIFLSFFVFHTIVSLLKKIQTFI